MPQAIAEKLLNLLESRDEVRNMCSGGMVTVFSALFWNTVFVYMFQDDAADCPMCVFDCAR